MHLTKLWYVKNLDVLKFVREANLEQFMRFTAMGRIKAYQDVCFPEQGSSHVYVVQEGQVRISRLDDEGGPIVTEILRPGEIFGKLPLEGGDIPNEFADATEDVTVCVMGRSNFETLMARFPVHHFHVTKWSGHLPEEYEENVSNLVFKDATRRITGFLARYALRFDELGDHPISVETPLSYHEIANLTGTSPHVVEMTVRKLHNKKLIDMFSQSLVFHDLAGLTKLAR